MEPYHLQPWKGAERVLELDTNIRSGEDKGFSEVLDECRKGQLSDSNYNFLHGLPASEDIVFWYEKKENA
eukprot:1053164-Karenia_brevis.AAC.1